MRIVKREFNPAVPPISDHSILNRIYQTRGVLTSDELNYSLKGLPSPFLLNGMTKMVDALEWARREQKKIVIIGDFDADGATSSAVGLLGLKMLGFTRVDYLVPDRFKHGYGLTPEIVQLALTKKPDILLTVDNGVSSFAGVDEAKRLGLTVLITDHHLPSDELPNADAIVNPNIKGDDFPSRSMAGVGVMFYVLGGLKMRLEKSQQLPAPVNLANLLDLVALGTVADVVPLDFVNRTLVDNGLRRIKAMRGRPGINALLAIAGRDSQKATTADFGFAVGPRLNAAGRMDDMSIGIECLIADTQDKANALAKQLNDFNVERRAVENSMKADALQLIDAMPIDHELHGLCLFSDTWHQGVIGILASRIKDLTYKPVIAFAPADGGLIKGSARSIPGIHIRDVLSNIAKDFPEILSKFGGHAMAAGLSIKQSDLKEFTLLFSDEIQRQSEGLDLSQALITDGELSGKEITLDLADSLMNAGPFGQGFPEPLFEGEFKVVDLKVLKDKHLKLSLESPDGQYLSAIKFNVEKPEDWWSVKQLKAAYRLSINEFRGNSTIQLMLDYIEDATQSKLLRHEFL